MKYLLTTFRLLRYPDSNSWTVSINRDRACGCGLPMGTQIDGALRVFQTCSVGLMYKIRRLCNESNDTIHLLSRQASNEVEADQGMHGVTVP